MEEKLLQYAKSFLNTMNEVNHIEDVAYNIAEYMLTVTSVASDIQMKFKWRHEPSNLKVYLNFTFYGGLVNYNDNINDILFMFSKACPIMKKDSVNSGTLKGRAFEFEILKRKDGFTVVIKGSFEVEDLQILNDVKSYDFS